MKKETIIVGLVLLLGTVFCFGALYDVANGDLSSAICAWGLGCMAYWDAIVRAEKIFSGKES